MKKFCASLLLVTMLLLPAPLALAENTTTLTTTVPPATYTLNIPADQVITFGRTYTGIGNVTVTDSAGFAKGKNLKVTLTWEDFACPDTDTTIPYEIEVRRGETSKDRLVSGGALSFYGNSDTTVNESAGIEDYFVRSLNVIISSSDWGLALAGDYTSTITFTAEVVVNK